jgi:hypothetical protein
MSAAAAITESLEEYAVVPGENDAGRPIFSVLVKRTYRIFPGQTVARVDPTVPLVKTDVFYDDWDPQSCTVKYESDRVAWKNATDVVLIGKAYSRSGKPTLQTEVALEIAGRKKVIRVMGDRHCVYRANQPPSFSDPTPFTVMEIRYERAYGGSDSRSIPKLEFVYPRNHLGTGVVLKNVRECIDGLALPNLEDRSDILTPERVILNEPEQWIRQPLPQGLGWYPKACYPRSSFVGAMPPFTDPDDVLREEELGIVPKGQMALARQFKLPRYDKRFHNGASLGLVLPYLAGGEKVKLTGLTPAGELSFSLPVERPRAMLDIGLGQNELPMVVHTVTLRPEDMQVDLVWRGAHEYPDLEWLAEIKDTIVRVF